MKKQIENLIKNKKYSEFKEEIIKSYLDKYTKIVNLLLYSV